MLLASQYLLSSFIISPHYVYFYAPIYQGNFLVCENLLRNKLDSDSDLAGFWLISFKCKLKRSLQFEVPG